MNNEQPRWSMEKQKQLQECLVGMWAEDTWNLTYTSSTKNTLQRVRFSLRSCSLNVEVKYAVWSKFDSGQWKITSNHSTLCQELTLVTKWLNHFAPSVQSLMERSLEEWKISFRSYLAESNRLRPRKLKSLSATQEYIGYIGEDRRILLFQQLYRAIEAVYDDRAETEKDIWDMRKMGLAVNLTGGRTSLSFTVISQLWLRNLAKEFLKYNAAIYSPGDCYLKLQCIRDFSQFIEQNYPEITASDINRSLIIHYISFLRACRVGDRWRGKVLSNLRIFFETCAQRLEIECITKERLIFNDDLPKWGYHPSREFPEEILEQLREHLDSLDTIMLRMVTILLECDMRINELCSLPLNCLSRDEEHSWFLRFYQTKAKQEHIIPLVSDIVISIIQTQQGKIRDQWGYKCPYLFPSIESPLQPFKTSTFAQRLNKWACKKEIRDFSGKLYHFQSHQFRHTVGMRLINDDVPLDVIGRLLGHHSLEMTQIYAQKRAAKVREEIEFASRRRKTINYQGLVVNGNALANTSDVQLLRKGNTIVLQNQDKIIPLLTIRVNSLEKVDSDDTDTTRELLNQLQRDIAEAEVGLDEARKASFVFTEKYLTRDIHELRARVSALE